MPKTKSNENSEEKTAPKSLAEQLRERMSRDEPQRESRTKLKQDISDEEIEKISKKISKKEVEEETKAVKKQKDGETLIPLEDYIKCAVHLGTKVITPHMRKFVYKKRADGLAVINTVSIDEKLREAIALLIKHNPEQIYLACKREAGWDGAKLFSQTTGIRAFTKTYPPGITTNLILENFFEAELTIICDPWIDRNALVDTFRLKKPVISFCDTNNYTNQVTKIIPCNNKAKKSIGCILYILAREYCKAKGIPFTATLEDFTGPLEEVAIR
ncbi:MAG: 30S ribosomal protein S2 [Nanoarchaeota archaeon]